MFYFNRSYWFYRSQLGNASVQRREYFGVVQLNPKSGRLREQTHLMSQMWESGDKIQVLEGHPGHFNPGNYSSGLIKNIAGIGKGEDEGICLAQAEQALSRRDMPCCPSGETPRVPLEGGSCPTGRSPPGTGTPRLCPGCFPSDTETGSWFPGGILGTQAERDPAHTPVSLFPLPLSAWPRQRPKPRSHSLPLQTHPCRDTHPPRSQPHPIPDHPREAETTSWAGWSMYCT